jgi:hypothetical protein
MISPQNQKSRNAGIPPVVCIRHDQGNLSRGIVIWSAAAQAHSDRIS